MRSEEPFGQPKWMAYSALPLVVNRTCESGASVYLIQGDCAVDCLAINPQPVADFHQNLRLGIDNHTVGVRRQVQEIISSFSNRVDEFIQNAAGAAEFFIVGVAPGRTNWVVDLPVAWANIFWRAGQPFRNR